MKLGFICDMHLSGGEKSPQFAFLKRGIETLKNANVDAIICVGDITAFGELDALEAYSDSLAFTKHYFVLGNSDVRDVKTRAAVLKQTTGFKFNAQNRVILGINTPFGYIADEDKNSVFTLNDGDILVMHHSVNSLLAESRAFLEEQLNCKAITVIHGHSHAAYDMDFGKSRVISLRGLDPDKAIGNYPSVVIFDIDEQEIQYSEEFLKLDDEVFASALDGFGLSCYHNEEDILFATEMDVKCIELRCANGDDCLSEETIELTKKWKAKTGGYLSIHMPNLYFNEKGFYGETGWYNALKFAKELNADSLTMHPPKVNINDFNDEMRSKFLELYVFAAKYLEPNVKIGIENLHLNPGEKENDRGFGYTPEEVSYWIDLINQTAGFDNRVGHVLDVGHARNNGVFAQRYPLSRWYELMGDKSVAYHLHQVKRENEKLTNHQAIEDWFGPMISFVSFFYCRENKIINSAPMFLEVKGFKHYQKTIDAFKKTFINANNP